MKGSDPIVLNYAIPEGQEFVLTTTGDSEMTTEVNGQINNVTTQSGSKMVFKSLGQNEGTGNNLRFKYTEMKQLTSSPMGEGETDFSTLLDKEFTLDLAEKGECSNFEGFDDFEPITSALGEQVDANVFMQGLKQMFFTLPDGPVEVGTTWNDDISNETPYGGSILKIDGAVNYTVTEIKDIDGIACVIIQSISEIKTSGKFQQQGMDLELNRTSKSNNKTTFAYKKGMFLSSEMSSVANGSVEVPAMNMSIPQEIIGSGNWKVEFK